jgi:hypothetical protein
MSATVVKPKKETNNLDITDKANVSQATASRLADGNLPPLPVIESPQWLPPSQSLPVVQGTAAQQRLMIYADADSHDWQEYVPDVPNAPNPTGGGTLQDYWDGNPPANYTLTMRSYWVLVPGSYTQVMPGETYEKQYTTTFGISTTDAQSLSAELGIAVEGLSATLTAEFSHSVTTSIQQQETTTYTVSGPAVGNIRVWMLWQLMDEVVALDPNGNVVSNPKRHGDVDWSQHGASGAFLQYTDVNQYFPSSILVPVTKDFPSKRHSASAKPRSGKSVG